MGSRMSGIDSWAIDRAVAELDHRVDDRLGVDDHVDGVIGDAEQLVGLDHLEALVHQGGGVDGDLRAHRPGRVDQRLGHVRPMASSSRFAPGTGRPTRSAAAAAPRPGRPARRHWCTAQCSESTGMISAPGVRRARCTTGAPAMIDSLLARANRRPASRAAMVTVSPANPTTPLTATSADRGDGGQALGAHHHLDRRAAGARPARRPVRDPRWPPPPGGAGGPGRPARPPSGGPRGPPPRNRSGTPSITSRAWVPMEPVDPTRLTVTGSERARARRRRPAPPPGGPGRMGPAGRVLHPSSLPEIQAMFRARTR